MRWPLRLLPFGRLAVVSFRSPLYFRSVEPYLALLQELETSKTFKGVLFQIDSPGGDPAASEILYAALRKLDAAKPVLCYAVRALSGGYWVACGARRILAPSTALVGSIGVITLKPLLSALMDRWGVRLEVFKKGAHKDALGFHRETTAEERGKIDALLEDLYRAFIDHVAERRQLDRERVAVLATGEVFTARQGMERGLVDRLCTPEEALEELSELTGVKKERAVTLRIRRPLLERLAGQAAHALADDLYLRLLAELQHEARFAPR